METEISISKSKMLAEIICKYCIEQKLTMKQTQSAFDIVKDKYLTDATI